MTDPTPRCPLCGTPYALVTTDDDPDALLSLTLAPACLCVPPEVRVKVGATATSPSYRRSRRDEDCSHLGVNPAEPCWGQVEDYWHDDDNCSTLCPGHRNIHEYPGDGNYAPETA